MRRELEGFPTLRLAVALHDKVGIGRIVAVHPRSSTVHQICYAIRCLYF